MDDIKNNIDEFEAIVNGQHKKRKMRFSQFFFQIHVATSNDTFNDR